MRRRDSPVPQPDHLPGGPLDAHVSVLRAELTRPPERSIGHWPQRQGKEVGIDRAGSHNDRP
jgi:hypothetical protein